MNARPEWSTSLDVLAVDKRRGHSLLPDADGLAGIPKLYATEKTPTRRKLVVLHYFVGSADWWVVELDPVEGLAFGFACLGDRENAEWGYVSLVELATLLIPVRLRRAIPRQSEGAPEFGGADFGVPVERDLYWTVRAVEDVPELAAFPKAVQR